MTTKGRQPPVPLWRRTIAQWSRDKQIDWAERAAIRQYDGGYSKEEAEKLAFDDLQKETTP